MGEERRLPTARTLAEHAGFLRGLCAAILSDEHLAEDIVQETCVAALRREGRSVDSPRAWLAAVARRLAWRSLRTRERSLRREAAVSRPEGLPSAAENAARLETQRKVISAVEALPEPARTVVILRYFDGVGPSEIAERLGVPVRTVESRLRRARDRVRRSLLREAGGDADAFRSSLLVLAFSGSEGARRVGVAGGLASVLGGAVIMSLKLKVFFLGAAVLLLGGVLWSTHSPKAPLPPPSPANPPAAHPGPGPEEDLSDPPEGSETTRRTTEGESGSEGRPAETRRLPASGCHGTIRHEDGSPLARTPVRLAPGAPEAFGLTDEQGRYAFRVAPVPNLVRRLLLLSEGEGTAHLDLGEVPLRAGEDVEANFRIPRGIPLTIEVRGPSGNQRSGVQLQLRPSGESTVGAAFAITGPDGRVLLPWLGVGPYVVSANPAGMRPFRGTVEPGRRSAGEVYVVDLEPSEDLVLSVGGWSEGSIGNFLLVLTPLGEEPPGDPFRHSGSLDRSGRWTGSAPPAGEYGLWLRVAGRVLTQERVRIPQGGPVEIQVAISAGVGVDGRLLFADGSPVKGGRIHFSAKEPPPLSLAAESAEDGSFFLGQLRPGRYRIDAIVNQQSFQDLVPEGLQVGPAGVRGLSVSLPELGDCSIGGLLVGFPPARRVPGRYVDVLRESPSGFRIWGRTRVDAVDGFLVGGLPAGRYRLSVHAMPALGLEGSGSVDLALAEGEHRREVVIRADERPELVIRLEKPGGEAFRESVTATAKAVGREESVLLRLVPDEEGRCPVSSLSAGTWRLTFFGGPDRFLSVEISVPEQPGTSLVIVLW